MEAGAVVIGVDYGTDSVRTVIVDAANGREMASAVFYYPRWEKGKYCDPPTNRFRQHPRDYLEGLEYTVKAALAAAPAGTASRVKGISIDTTGSTPVAVDRNGTPLALTPGFEEEPDAMFILWKDHTAVREAAEINTVAKSWGGIDYTEFEGGIYSSEWFWAKLLHVFRVNPRIREAAYSWVEHCDWIPAVLTGNTDPLTLKRSRCAAGHKAMWHASYDGLPSEEFLVRLDPLLAGLRARLYRDTSTNEVAAGQLAPGWAAKLGLPSGVTVGVGAFDAHMGAVGGEIRPYVLTKIMGTSTCDMLVAPTADLGNKPVRGICGQVDGSILPGMVGLEAGQSAFGDVYAWFIDVLLWPVHHVIGTSGLVDAATRAKLIEEAEEKTIRALSDAASIIAPETSGVLALDWMNGRRTPDANQLLKGAIAGLNLGSDAPRIFRALVEATAFGARQIVDRFRSEGVRIDGVIALGGVAKKSPFIMQTVADVMGMPIAVPNSDQTCALGAAMCAAAAAGIHPTLDAAKKAMGSGVEREYRPDPGRTALYAKLYERYQRLGAFIETEIMKEQGDTMNPYAELQARALACNLRLPASGLVTGTFGNASAFDRQRGVFAIKPSGVPFNELKADDLPVLDVTGKVVYGSLRPSSDMPTHALLYEAWPDIGGVVHTHSPYAVAWAQAMRPIPVFGTTHADHCDGDIPCTAPMADERIAGDYEVETGRQILDTLAGISHADVTMILVACHGPFTWGTTPEKAVDNSIALELIAQMALHTIQIAPATPRLKESLLKKHFERKHGPDAYYGQASPKSKDTSR